MEDPLSDCSPATVTGVVASATLQRLLTVTVRSPGSRPLLGRMGALGATLPLVYEAAKDAVRATAAVRDANRDKLRYSKAAPFKKFHLMVSRRRPRLVDWPRHPAQRFRARVLAERHLAPENLISPTEESASPLALDAAEPSYRAPDRLGIPCSSRVLVRAASRLARAPISRADGLKNGPAKMVLTGDHRRIQSIS